MKKLKEHYSRFERDVGALEKFVVFLFCLLAGYAIYLVYLQKSEDALKMFMPLGALISALLVAKVASRLLAHNHIIREDDRRQDVVMVTHHLLATLIDLRQRVRISIRAFSEGGIPLLFLIENSDAIEKRYEIFLDREVYRYLRGETIELIMNMSGHVFGFSIFVKTLTDISHCTAKTIIVIEGLESLLKDFDALDEQIRQLRETLD